MHKVYDDDGDVMLWSDYCGYKVEPKISSYL
jgi:hypothetical protein